MAAEGAQMVKSWKVRCLPRPRHAWNDDDASESSQTANPPFWRLKKKKRFRKELEKTYQTISSINTKNDVAFFGLGLEIWMNG